MSTSYRLVSDIDASGTGQWNAGKGFKPIGDIRTPESFSGTFDGNGYEISGLTINRPGESRVGLFDHVWDGTVVDVSLIEVSISGDTRVGGVVGFAEGGDLSGLSVSGTIEGTSSVGGIVGVFYNIEGSSTQDPVPSTLSESFVGGEVSGDRAGSIAGQNRGTIKAIYSAAAVSGDSFVGGIVGLNGNEGVVQDSYAAEEITGTDYVGGIVGQSGGEVIESYWDTEETGQQDGIGLGSAGANVEGLTTAEMKGAAAENNMEGFDFSGTWGVVKGAGISYPYLLDNRQTPEPGLVVDLAIRDGSADQLDFSAEVSPGTDNNPIGILSLGAARSDAAVEALTATNNSPGIEGIEAARLFWSTDRTLDPSDDTELSEVSVDASTAPASFAFSGFSRPIPTTRGYLIVAIDVTAEASASGVQFTLEDPEDLSLSRGAVRTVNGSDQTTFSALPLSNGASALPVEMASFDGTTTENGVQLTWRTASEQNNAGFRVQRRVSDASAPGARRVGARERRGESAWAEVGFVEGSGTTSEPRSYRFTDTALPYAADSVSYRLKQVDTDGSTSLTDAVTVARGGPERIQLLGTAPNPVRQRATVRYGVPESLDGPVRLALYDVLGRQVRTVRAEAEPGRHEQTLDVSGLASGVYVLRLTAAGTAKTRKLTVVR